MSARLEDILARRLREVAKARKLPLSHVADRAGVARSYFWLLLEGEKSATLALVQRLAEALEVSPLELLETRDRRDDKPAVSDRRAATRTTRHKTKRPRVPPAKKHPSE